MTTQKVDGHQKKKKKDGCISVHEQKWTNTKKEKIDDKVTLSHVGKSIP